MDEDGLPIVGSGVDLRKVSEKVLAEGFAALSVVCLC